MKRTISIVAGLLLALLLAGCGQGASGQTAPNYSADEILTAIKTAYGADYLPNTEIPEEMLKDAFGLDLSAVEEVKGEMPTIGFHPDRVIVVKAVSGKGDAVETALKAARETLIQDTMQYPANLAKVNASQVVRSGDYVCFLLVGAPDDTSTDEAAAAQFAAEQTQKGADAFYGLFQEG